MSFPVPNLDKVEFEELVEQARALIPRYAPEWTDHNVHDPGMMLLDLIAWIVDQESFQLGFISDKHIEAFAALLGVRRQLAVAAQGLIWPPTDPINSATLLQGVDLDQGAAAFCPEQTELRYQTRHGLHISSAELLAIETQSTFITRDKFVNESIISLNDQRRAGNRVVELIFDRPLIQALSPHPMCLGVELVNNEHEYLDNDQLRSNKLLRESLQGKVTIDYRIEQAGEPWRRLRIEHDETNALNYSGYLLVSFPNEAVEVLQNLPNTSRSRIRIQITERANPLPVKIRTISHNVIPVEQLELKPRSPFLRTSFGEPDESFEVELASMPATENLELEVEESGQFVAWNEISSLEQAGPNDRVFQLLREQDRVVFGNGINGKIPPKNSQIRHLDYRVTRGTAGNQITGLAWQITGAPALAGAGVFGFNRLPIRGGQDRWTLAQLRAAARRFVLDRKALLSNQQLTDRVLTLEKSNVDSAKVLVGYHPFLCNSVSGSRTVVVTPKRDMTTDVLEPVPLIFSRDIESRILDENILGEKIHVLASKRVAISVTAELIIEDGADPDETIAIARERLNARLSDIALPNDDSCFEDKTYLEGIEPWPIGRAVSCQEIKVLLANTPGVVAISQCLIGRLNETPSENDIELAPIEIAIGAQYTLTVFDQRSDKQAKYIQGKKAPRNSSCQDYSEQETRALLKEGGECYECR